MAIRFAAASSLMWAITAGKYTVTPPIQHSKRLCCTFSLRGAIANFSRVQDRIATCRKLVLIQQFYRMHSAQMFRWREWADARRRSKICQKNGCTAFSTLRHNFGYSRKRIRNKIDHHGRDEALFQELAAALGYKENKLPFTLVAQRLPLKLLREKPDESEALLFGVAGFLEAPDLGIFKGSTRKYVRQLWDRWWPHRDAMQRIILPSKVWRLSSTRPLNHPQRRLSALSMIVREWPALRRSTDLRATSRLPSPQSSPTGRGGSFSPGEKARMRGPGDFFSDLHHPFWNFHYTLTSGAASKKMALIGESRIADILANVLFPFWLADDLEIWPAYAQLPARLSNRRLETAATRLFGNDSRRKQFLETVAHQQGLLQIYEDFCMQDNSDCAQCPFPEQMAKWK